jgi:hypothetical protein
MLQRGSKTTRHGQQDGNHLTPLLPLAPDPDSSEVTKHVGSGQSNPANTDAERLKEIFEEENDDFRLEEHRLKADSRMEYARRLTYLYIYAHELAGRKPITIDRVRRMLDACKVLDNNTRNELTHRMALEIDGENVRLKREGRERAVAALNQILDPGADDPAWTPESQSRSSKGGETKDAKPSGKPGRKKSAVPEEWAAKWEKLSEKPDAHFALKGKGLLEKSIGALWAIHKVGGKTASFRFIQRFIAEAFSFNEKERSIDKCLTRDTAREFVIKADGGFKLTPSGGRKAEELLKVK